MRFPVSGPHGGALWRAVPVLTHDGDTIRFRIDRGWEDDSKKWIRLGGDFMPELKDPGGPQCRAFAVSWLIDHGDGTEWPFLVESIRTPRSDVEVDMLGRFIGYVLAADGHCLNDDVETYRAANDWGTGTGGSQRIP